MFFCLSFVILIFALALSGTPVKRDALEVELDIQLSDTQLQSFDDWVNTLPVIGGLSDVEANPVLTDPEADIILALVGNSIETTKEILQGLVSQEIISLADDAAGLAKSDLEILGNDVNVLGTVLEAKMPSDKKSAVQVLAALTGIDNTLTSAMTAFKWGKIH